MHSSLGTFPDIIIMGKFWLENFACNVAILFESLSNLRFMFLKQKIHLEPLKHLIKLSFKILLNFANIVFQALSSHISLVFF